MNYGSDLRKAACTNTAESLDYFWANVDKSAYFSPDQLTHYEIVGEYVGRVFGQRPTGTPFWVLDVGCGPGYMESALLRYLPGASLVGIDYAHSAIAYARQMIPDGAVFYQHDIEQHPLPPGSAFDLILCIECLEHIRDWQKALDHMLAALVPNGSLILTVPNGDIDKGPPPAPYHVNFWSQADITRIMSERGQVVHVQWIRGVMSTLIDTRKVERP